MSEELPTANVTELFKLVSSAMANINASMHILDNKLNGTILALQETRDVVEKLGKVYGLEYSNDVKEWVSAEKLKELKETPR